MISIRKSTPWTLAAAALTVALSLSAGSRAQPTGGNIMTDLTLIGGTACTTARIGFNFPVRYIDHFPQERGVELRIRLKAVSAPFDTLNLMSREAFSPVDDATALSSVIYEGDMSGGPVLSLQFSRSVYFRVTQGVDFRSMVVFFSDTASGCALPPGQTQGDGGTQ